MRTAQYDLHQMVRLGLMRKEGRAPALKHMRPLLSGADVAAKGVGCGPVVRVHPDEDLTHFPEGAVMLMQHSSPNAMTASGRRPSLPKPAASPGTWRPSAANSACPR